MATLVQLAQFYAYWIQLLFSSFYHLQDQRERKASKGHMEEETAKPAEMDKTPKKNPFVPLQVGIIVKGNVFTSVCQKFYPRGRGGGAVSASESGGVHPPGRHPLSWADTLLPPETATASDGTHPTGMHSCLVCLCFVSYPPGWTGPTLVTKRNSGSNQWRLTIRKLLYLNQKWNCNLSHSERVLYR